MATTRFNVTFEDGREETYKVKPRHLIAYEDEVGDVTKVETIRNGYLLAYFASESPLPYDEWLKTVEDIYNPDAQDVPAAEVNVEGGEAEVVPTE